MICSIRKQRNDVDWPCIYKTLELELVTVCREIERTLISIVKFRECCQVPEPMSRFTSLSASINHCAYSNDNLDLFVSLSQPQS